MIDNIYYLQIMPSSKYEKYVTYGNMSRNCGMITRCNVLCNIQHRIHAN